AMRPYGLGGSPWWAVGRNSLQVRPPSALRESPPPDAAFGPSPPERNVQPLRRKSQSAASNTSGLPGCRATLAHPVERLAPFRISCQLLPPSTVLYRPRAAESLHSFPGTQA